MFTELDFSSVVAEIGLHTSNVIRCPDQWVGDVVYSPDGFSYLGNSPNDFTWRKNLSKASSYFKNKFSLLIILESPHVDEYKMNSDGSISAIGPANGQTGRSLRTYLDTATVEIAKQINFKTPEKFNLLLMNAVPYQCSLGKRLKGQNSRDRDAVFLNCWNYAKEDFIERLMRYANEKTIVINACTKGTRKRGHALNLSRQVDESVASLDLFKNSYFKRCHPSSTPHWKIGRSW
ncbi:MAG: hypothetical protein WBJ45_11735 [Limnohabitans sp.]|uniref:hypothetical protein n=1 Tax=Limnohabitans sp. TaxID=1907725 RepID=UPI003BB0834E